MFNQKSKNVILKNSSCESFLKGGPPPNRTTFWPLIGAKMQPGLKYGIWAQTAKKKKNSENGGFFRREAAFSRRKRAHARARYLEKYWSNQFEISRDDPNAYKA